MPEPERSAGAVTECKLTVFHLAGATLTAQLLGRFDHQEDSSHTGMIGRQPTTIGVDRQFSS
jgi:hypothetical protein